jgi:eukaryotic translation initiation factor 2C
LAVVGSTDGMLGQYAAYISSTMARDEPVNDLDTAVGAVLDTFCQRNNGKMPKRIIVYRDGVADNQFHEILEKELGAYKNALNHRGYNEEAVQIAMVICQKRHQARLVYDSKEHGFLNPCVGLCVDARMYKDRDPTKKNSDENDPIGSISSPGMNEFYLNSHAAVLGTSKPCKYTLIYDEIGIKVRNITHFVDT